MSQILTPLPQFTLAPNGPRLMRSDHPAVPLRLEEIVAEARAAQAAGCDGLSLYLRTETGAPLIDSGAYREAVEELREAVPALTVQASAVQPEGAPFAPYPAHHLLHVAVHSAAPFAAVGFADHLWSGASLAHLLGAAAARDTRLLITLHDPAEAVALGALLSELPPDLPRPALHFVLGAHGRQAPATPSALGPFLRWMAGEGGEVAWAVSAYGREELACLTYARAMGGHVRAGLETSLAHPDGRMARDNAERVAVLLQGLNSAAA